MSLFHTISLPCPACGETTDFEMVQSVNADRRPDLRIAILDASFQRKACGKCSLPYRLQPQMTYLDVGRSQWIGAFPYEKLKDWEAVEQQARTAYDLAFGANASPGAREIGADLKARVTFGWPGLCEKILAAEHGLDDVNLELVKMAIIAGADESPLSNHTELRLVEVDEDGLMFEWLASATEETVERLRVPRSLYDEITADLTDWQPLREQLSGVLFADMQRLIVAGAT